MSDAKQIRAAVHERIEKARDGAADEVGEFVDKAFAVLPRYECDSYTCPGRPDWDKGRDEMWKRMTDDGDALLDEAIGTLEGHLAVAFAEYLEKYPDAPRAKLAA